MGQITEHIFTCGFKVNYISIDNKGTPIEKIFGDKQDLTDWFDEISTKNKDKRVVYLMSFDGENVDDLVFVSQYKDSIYITMLGMLEGEINVHVGYEHEIDDEVIFLQEFDSYEEAYKVALSMQEEQPYCYSEKERSIKINLQLEKNNYI